MLSHNLVHDSVGGRNPLKAIPVIGLRLEMLLFRCCKSLQVRWRVAVQQVLELHSCILQVIVALKITAAHRLEKKNSGSDLL